MYLNYDGAGGKFGDTSIDADTSNIANSAVYASVDSTTPTAWWSSRSIGRQTRSRLASPSRTTASSIMPRCISSPVPAANPQAAADIELDLFNAFQYTMPAYSVTTLVLISDGLPGDFNRDGTVDGADYTVWRNYFGAIGNTAADANEDDVVDEDDYVLWRSNYGRSVTNGAGSLASVPEPSTLVLVLIAGLGISSSSQRRQSCPKRELNKARNV